MVLRGGSSKGAYFLRDDLPADVDERDRMLRSIMGTPDSRQIDGIGGAHPLTSKVAVVALSPDPEADVDYLFLQVGVEHDTVSDRQNCGNLLAGVGPFAVERGLVTAPDGGVAELRIRMLNTNSIAVATFSVLDGLPVYAGGTSISGVPGTASPIHLEFKDLAGGSTGSLLPTGSATDEIDGVPVTLVDNGMPVVVMRARDLAITGYESCAELEANAELRQRLEAIRIEAGVRMNLGDVTDTTVPKLTMVAAPQGTGHLSTRTFIPHRCHEAIGVLGAVSVATAALLPGSPASDVLRPPTGDIVQLEHPTGVFDAFLQLGAATGSAVTVERAGIVRTARKLMDGYVFPRDDSNTQRRNT